MHAAATTDVSKCVLIRRGRDLFNSFSQITNVITTNVAPDWCIDAGGNGSVEYVDLDGDNDVLSILQTEDVHWRIKCHLGELTNVAKKPGGSSHSSNASERIVADHEIVTFVYPVKPGSMTPDESIEMIELVLGQEILGRE